MNKKELREEAKRRVAESLNTRVAHPTDTTTDCEKILALTEYKNADIVLSYIAMKSEADPIEITKAALKEGKKVAVPKIHGDEMDFYFLSPDRPIEEQLETGAFGILEPTSSEKFVPENHPAPDGESPAKIFIVTPGLAFSKSGKRCGRGKGFYDKYFSRLKATGADFFAAGFCYPCQIFNDDEIPTDENDFLMDFV